MKPLRVILLLLDPPLPFGRAMGRWFSVLLKGLKERGHDVTAFAICPTQAEADRSLELFPSPEYDLRCYLPDSGRRGLASKLETIRRPYSYLFSSAMRREFEAELARGYDILHLELLWAGWMGLDHREKALISIPYLFEIDLTAVPPKDWRDALRRRITFRAERALLRRFPRIATVSPRLSRRVREIAPGAEISTIPLGLDHELYPFRPRLRTDDAPVVGLVGTFNWQPNVSSGLRILDKLWPEIKRRVPNARLKLAGVYAQTVFQAYRNLPDVMIEDRVTDVEGFFRSIDLLLYAPEHGSGMKFKVMEAFAYGVPVVTNSQGTEGMPVEDGVHAGVAEDDAGLIDRVVALLLDPTRADSQLVAARQLLESHCGPRPTLDAVEQVYARILAATDRSELATIVG